MYGHRYVIRKYEKMIAKWDNTPKVFDKKDKKQATPLIEVKSSFDGKIAEVSKKSLENTLSDTKAAMAKFEIIGAIANGYDENYSRNLFKQMAKFAGYAFNRPHSGCYADETFQTAWLKAHYPVYFMTALLTTRGDKADKTLESLKETKRMGIKILPPNINKSSREFRPENGDIRYGLLSIGGIGTAAVDAIMDERKKNGNYVDFDDFHARTTYPKSPINRGVYRTLIAAGCFDEFEWNRYALLNYYNFDIRRDKKWAGHKVDLDADPKAKSNHSFFYDEASYTDKIALQMEHELIGIYVSGSPFDGLPFTSLADMKKSSRREKHFYEVGGKIANVRVIKTKKGDPMAFVTFETQLEPMDITFFPTDFEANEQHLYKDNIVVIRGYKEESMYRDEMKQQFIGSKILTKEAKKLKKSMGMTEQAPPSRKARDDDQPVLAQLKSSPKKADPVAEMMKDDRKKSKKKRDPNDVSKYFEDEEDEITWVS